MSQKKYGFTLIELLITITLIAILSAIGIIAYAKTQSIGRDARRKQDLRAIKVALELYRQNNNAYPQPWSGIAFSDSGTGWTTTLKNSLIPATGNTYINQLPVDPLNTATSRYAYYSLDGSSYVLGTILENNTDRTGDCNPQFNLGFNGCNFLITD